MNEYQSSTGPAAQTMNHEKSIRFVSDLAEKVAGISLPDSKAPMVRARLLRRIRSIGVSDIEEYCRLLDGGKNKGEMDELISVLTTNVTTFYRESHHFDHFSAYVLDALISRAVKGEKIRLWSAGCSTGQEPYSLAIEILSRLSDAHKYDIRILATDIDRAVLSTAETGIYDKEALLPLFNRHGHAFVKSCDCGESSFQISDEARNLVRFRRLNLMDQWPISTKFQVLFCRNVMIYFSKETQEQLCWRFKEILEPSAYLYLGHSERIETPERLEAKPVGITTYQFA